MSAERIIRRGARRFAESELKKIARDLDEERRFPREQIDKLAEQMGAFGILVDPEYGGAGGSLKTLVTVLEELARGCASTAAIVLYGNLASYALYKYGGEQVKKDVLMDVALGVKIGTFAVNEPGWDYSLKNLNTVAVKSESGYRVKGVKSLVVGGTNADVYIVIAAIDGSVDGFLVFKDDDGVRVAGPTDTLGLRAAHLSQLILDVEIPEWRRLNMGETGVQELLSILRIGVAAIGLGLGIEAYTMAREYANVRVQFGVKIGRFEAIQDMLVNMLLDVETSRLVIEKAAEAGSKEIALLSMIARLYTIEVMLRTTKLGIKVHGGYGYMREMPLERFARDVRTLQMLGEPNDALKRLIGEAELGYIKLPVIK